MPRPGRASALLAIASVPLFGCAAETEAPVGPPVLSRGLAACVDGGPDGRPHAGLECRTHRAIGGVSMGGGAAARIGLEHPELFDAVMALGAPYIDLETFLLSVGEISNGGFCDRERLLARLDRIDARDDPEIWCGPVVYEELALPGTRCDGFSGDFNHHYRGPAAGRGGGFDREGSFEIVQDFAHAYGNPAFYNPDSAYLPPGVPLEAVVSRALDAPERRAERASRRAELCARPLRLTGVRDGRFNPTGEHPVILFCDGNGPELGVYEPGTARFPVEVTLAVDYNDNGRRDYGEPVLAQTNEPYEDVGADGLASADEPGYDPILAPDPAGDDYHWLDNPSGTEGDDRWQPGEPCHDLGLDDVAGTGDLGEGNGRCDLNPNVAAAFERSPRVLMERLAPEQLDRLHLWVDAGIRDFLLSAQITNRFYGAVRQRAPGAALLDDWAGLAARAGQAGGRYDPLTADLSPEAIGRHAYLRYGDPSVCPGVDAAEGRGNHVGPAWEILWRLQTALAFASSRLAGGDFSAVRGVLSELGGPTGGLSDFVQLRSFDSPALGRAHPYVVVLPPDYYVAPAARYPVVYFLHGQGQKASDLAASALLFLGPQMSSSVEARERRRLSDWQKMILIFADGECQAGECHVGTFYLDFQDLDRPGARHGEAFFELMRHVDASYRTRPPELVPR